MKLSNLASSSFCHKDSLSSHTSVMTNSSQPFKCQVKEDIFHVTKIRNKKKWTPEEDSSLINLASIFQERHWKEIASHFKNKNSLQCFSRYKRIKPGVLKGHWTSEEDKQIVELVSIYGRVWSKIAKMLKTRNGKQIRDRFTNVLDPNIAKNKFTDEEDRMLIQLYMTYGPKWSIIAKKFPERTADMIKNRFHSSIKKLFYGESLTICHRQRKTLKRMKMKKELLDQVEQKISQESIPTSYTEETSLKEELTCQNKITPNVSFCLKSIKENSKERKNVDNFDESIVNNTGIININNAVNEAILNELNDDIESQNNNILTICDDDYFNY